MRLWIQGRQCLVCSTQQSWAHMHQPCFWLCWKNLYLRLRLCFPPHVLICTHPKSCQPVGLLFCRVCTPSARMLPSPPPGEGSSRWEMPAVLWLVSGPTSSHFDGQRTPWWHPPALWIPSWSNRLNHFSFLFHCFHLFPPWPFLFLPDLFFFPLPFFHLFSFLFSLLKVFSYGKARGNSVCKQMHRDSKNIDGRVRIPNAVPVLNDAHRWMRYWCVGSVFLSVFLFHEPILSPPHPCRSTCREQCYEVSQGKCPCQKEPPFFVNISCLPALSCYHFKVISKIFNLLNSEWIVI